MSGGEAPVRQPPFFVHSRRHGTATALVDGGETWSYDRLFAEVDQLAGLLRPSTTGHHEPRVCFLVAPGADWVRTQWAVWSAGGVAVPLAISHPVPELRYVLEDTEPVLAIADHVHAERLRDAAGGTAVTVVELADLDAEAAARAPDTGAADGPPGPAALDPDAAAMILYTSGTTSRPKGVVSTHRCIAAQVAALRSAWGWSAHDRILHVLPLHHVHGIVNVLSCALASGATCEFAHPFDAERVWERLASGEVTVFMAVPTIYRRLIAAWEDASVETRARWSAGIGGLRLMVSGSAALPVTVLERWRELTGHTLLERYGMTEIGMGLSNPLHGERRAGTVGTPLPGVVVRLVDEAGAPVHAGTPGQIQIRGPQLFREYWRRDHATRDAFVDGWFRTGDQAVVEDGYFRILGRRSVDIIKSGGYKISALEIEAVMLEHPDIVEIAVVGVEDPEWGERVSAAVVPRPGAEVSEEALRPWCKERLAPYKVPREIRTVEALPRNAMGKVTKPKVRDLFAANPRGESV